MQTQDKDNKTIEKEPQKEELVKPLPQIPTWPTGLRFSKNEGMEISAAKDLAVVLTHHVFEQLFGWAYSTNREISCLGSIRRDGNIFIVEQMHLLKQTSSSVSTEIDETAIAELIEKLIAEGKNQEVHSIKCWAHSHPGMGVFWSGTDSDTCRLLASDYLVSIENSHQNACKRGNSNRVFQITHPFHPLSGQQFTILYCERYHGEDWLFFQNSEHHRDAIPACWTSLKPPNPYIAISDGRSLFCPKNLLELVQLARDIKSAKKQHVPKRAKI